MGRQAHQRPGPQSPAGSRAGAGGQRESQPDDGSSIASLGLGLTREWLGNHLHVRGGPCPSCSSSPLGRCELHCSCLEWPAGGLPRHAHVHVEGGTVRGSPGPRGSALLGAAAATVCGAPAEQSTLLLSGVSLRPAQTLLLLSRAEPQPPPSPPWAAGLAVEEMGSPRLGGFWGPA